MSAEKKTAKKATKNPPKKKEPKYKQIIAMNDEKINILILGTSGSGKSTLINSILEANEAPTGAGEAVTKEIKIYQNDVLPFRMIDTVGYEYGFLRQRFIKRDIAKFCKEGVKSADVQKLIHMIWFCSDGTTKRINQDVLDYIKSVTNDWENVPIVMVVTKSYSKKEIDENIDMANEAIIKYNATHKRKPLNVKSVIPVVAKEYQIDDGVTVAPFGLDDLIEKTIELAPEAKKISESTIREIDLKLKNATANAYIGAASVAATVVGAVRIPVPDAAVLVPVQSAMLNRLSSLYGLNDKDSTSEIVETIMSVGATTMVGRALLKSLKMIPGIGIAASVLNAAVAGTVTLAAGQICNELFERVYKNEIDPKTMDLKNEISSLFNKYIPAIIKAWEKLDANDDGKVDKKEISKAIFEIAKSFLKDKGTVVPEN